MKLIENKSPFAHCSKKETYPRISGVYLIENLTNGKKYIGQSFNVHRRWFQHTTKPFSTRKTDYEFELYEDIRKLGIENFSFSILELAETKERLKKREIYWIEKLNTLSPNGYNKTKGGDNVKGHISDKDFWKIVELLKKGTKAKEIRDAFGISIQSVTDINVGRYRKQETLEYPLKRITKKHYHCSICGKIIEKNKSMLCKKCYESNKGNHTKHDKQFFELIRKEVELSNNNVVAKKYGVSWHTINNWTKK